MCGQSVQPLAQLLQGPDSSWEINHDLHVFGLVADGGQYRLLCQCGISYRCPFLLFFVILIILCLMYRARPSFPTSSRIFSIHPLVLSTITFTWSAESAPYRNLRIICGRSRTDLLAVEGLLIS
ncbi:hypothetical protein BCR44DRAFT_1432193 [Catenaria anguillulae PL171]|uniref:Uncharacterized protein n=1 Tax=Catenaria anguillulae PL171 TaxID=765915 RepID=A0A1Y2HPR5_9FUNG|nr:hypothetical protein BCR44DRAFT_1432193 [Catenaria anguillulae PL171]